LKCHFLYTILITAFVSFLDELLASQSKQKFKTRKKEPVPDEPVLEPMSEVSIKHLSNSLVLRYLDEQGFPEVRDDFLAVISKNPGK
jgi:hypothetical protein